MTIKIHKDTLVTYICSECEHQWEVLNPKNIHGTKHCPECGVSDDVEDTSTTINTGLETFMGVINPFFTVKR